MNKRTKTLGPATDRGKEAKGHIYCPFDRGSKNPDPFTISKDKMEQLYSSNCTLSGKTDPILFPHRYTEFHDIETVAFISAIMAYGTIKQICIILEKVIQYLGPVPGNKIRELTIRELRELPEEFYHRFYTSKDIAALLYSMQQINLQFGSLQRYYKSVCLTPGTDFRTKLATFQKGLRDHAISFLGKGSHGITFMFPDPKSGSACKRLHLFLRWMVRKDAVDFGIWDSPKAAELLIPVDTHIEQVAKQFRLTTRKAVSWGMAEEITKSLRHFNADDPVRYDFSLCHADIKRKAQKGGK